ncbi:MAG TPA: MarR family winged helix-turn-helix transcriptional regulator [Stellaceae bacterium]|nr:MarR family winged helix-turn-helix transcriptional regulator [Stellaceae bacterium]
MDDEFIELISLADRIHRRCLDFVQDELEQLAVHDITPTQALMLINIGHMPVSPTELIVRGDYPGTNPSYNVNRLVECGLVTRERRTRDRRSNAVRLTDKGHNLRRLILALHRRQSEQLVADGARLFADVAGAADVLRQLEHSLAAVAGGERAPRGSRQSVAAPARRRRRQEH